MSAYLFVHFREKWTEDGEQVHFALSKDGYRWEETNGGKPVLCATTGDLGVRDIVIARTLTNEFVILATDLAMIRNGEKKYGGNMRTAFRIGSKSLAMWKSKDLLHWSDEIPLTLGDGTLGCLWAPGIFFDRKTGEYIVHWSSAHKDDDYAGLSIYYSKTKDFDTFTAPALFYKKPDSEMLDSFITEKDGIYHFFVKSVENPKAVIHETSRSLFGPYVRDETFDAQMRQIEDTRAYEAPMTYTLSDGRVCFMMDFFGCAEKEKQGYVPYVMESLDDMHLTRADEQFKFPYGFKHGVVLEITDEEYERVRSKYE